jgi:cyclopropane fatty-acyl-phospholipid synthase-like methyltransferase
MTIKKTAAKKARVPAKKPQVKKAIAKVKSTAKARGKSGAKDVLRKAAKKPKKDQKKKVVRDSFTMPQNEYAKIAEIKAICLSAKMHVKKSEVLRAGLKKLAELNAAQLKRALGSLEKIKTGRPHKH